MSEHQLSDVGSVAQSAQVTQSQQSYKPSSYQVLQWQREGERNLLHNTFVSSQYDFLKRDQRMTDAMFADFGGRIDQRQFARGSSPLEEAVQSKDEEIQKLRDEVASLQGQLVMQFEAGREKGREESLSQQQHLQQESVNAFRAVVEDFQSHLQGVYAQVERDGVAVALRLVEKLLGMVVEGHPDYIGQVVREALRHTGSGEIRAIRVSPQDYEFIEVVGITRALDGVEHKLQFVADPLVKTGCIVETGQGEVDAQLDAALERIKGSIITTKL